MSRSDQVNGGQVSLRQAGPGEVVKGLLTEPYALFASKCLVAETTARQKSSGPPQIGSYDAVMRSVGG